MALLSFVDSTPELNRQGGQRLLLLQHRPRAIPASHACAYWSRNSRGWCLSGLIPAVAAGVWLDPDNIPIRITP